MAETLQRAILKAAFLFIAMGLAVLAAVQFPILRAAAPYVFASLFLFNVASERFEKPTREKLEKVKVSDLYSEQESRGLRYQVDRLKRKEADLFYLSWLTRVALAVCGGSLFYLPSVTDRPLAILIGYAAFGTSVVICIAQWRLSKESTRFLNEYEADIEQRKVRQRQLNELRTA